jgi:hypothetical protein
MTDEKTQLAIRSADPELDRFARLGQWLAAAESGSSDANTRGAAAALRIYYAEELNLPPWASAEISIIKGRLTPSAKLFRALAAREGLDVRPTDETDQACTAVLINRATGEELGRRTYTLAMAKKADLIKPGSAWEKHPQRMLWARAAKFVLDDYAPHVTLGLMTEDEAVEIAGEVIDETYVSPIDEPDAFDEIDQAIDDERKAKLHRQLHAIINSADPARAPVMPDGSKGWDEYSRYLARTRYKVESRAQLTADQLAEIVKVVQVEAAV